MLRIPLNSLEILRKSSKCTRNPQKFIRVPLIRLLIAFMASYLLLKFDLRKGSKSRVRSEISIQHILQNSKSFRFANRNDPKPILFDSVQTAPNTQNIPSVHCFLFPLLAGFPPLLVMWCPPFGKACWNKLSPFWSKPFVVRSFAEGVDSKSPYLAIDASSVANSFKTEKLRLSAFQNAIFC